MGEKERFEVLLEEIRGEVKIIAEGLVALRQEMNERFDSLYRQLHSEIGDLRADVKLFVKATNQRFLILESKVGIK